MYEKINAPKNRCSVLIYRIRFEMRFALRLDFVDYLVLRVKLVLPSILFTIVKRMVNTILPNKSAIIEKLYLSVHTTNKILYVRTKK